jgi:hypothetical protein
VCYWLLGIALLCEFSHSSPSKENFNKAKIEPLWSYNINNHDIIKEYEEVSTEDHGEHIRVKYTPKDSLDLKTSEYAVTTFHLGVDMADHVQKWLIPLKIVRAEIRTKPMDTEKYILIWYKTNQENGVWKFTQGEDGTYGIGYTFNPKEADLTKVEQWVKAIKTVVLSQ